MRKLGVVTIKWSKIWASSKTIEPKWGKHLKTSIATANTSKVGKKEPP